MVLEEDWQHGYAQWRGLAETRSDREVSGRGIGDQNQRALDGCLAGEALSCPEMIQAALRKAVGGDPGEFLLPALRACGIAGQVDGTVLRRGERRELAEDQPRQLQQIAVALHEPGNPGQIGLQPVLL